MGFGRGADRRPEKGDGPLFPQGAAYVKQPTAPPSGGAISTTLEPTGHPQNPSPRPRWIFWNTWGPSLRKRRRRHLLRSLGRTAGHGLVRGITTTAGGALVTGTLWWIQHH